MKVNSSILLRAACVLALSIAFCPSNLTLTAQDATQQNTVQREPASQLPNRQPSSDQAFSPFRDEQQFFVNQASTVQEATQEQFRRELSNVPDDIGYQLHESDDEIDAIFRRGPLSPLHRVWECKNKCLKERTGLDLGLNYTTVFQYADSVVSGPRETGDGDLDFFGRWHLLGDKDHWPGSLVFSTETRHKFTQIPPTQLNTGTVGGTIVGFGVQDFSVVQLYWEGGSFEAGSIYRAGKMDPALIFDGGRYVSSNYAFFSPAFSDTQPMPLPGAGLGLAGAVYPTKSTYIVGGIHDANGKRTTSGFGTPGDGEYFTAVELGWFPNEKEVNEGLYHITFWNTDARPNANRRSDRGIALTLEQQVGPRGKLVPFLRYAYAHRGVTGIRQNLSLGFGFEDVFGQNSDIAGLAWSWQQPADRSLRDQGVIETFYRFHITPHTHLSPDIQLVLNPANAPGKEAVTVFGLRMRTLY